VRQRQLRLPTVRIAPIAGIILHCREPPLRAQAV
jgi:hypothetical protein